MLEERKSIIIVIIVQHHAGADPGFPIGWGANTPGEGTNTKIFQKLSNVRQSVQCSSELMYSLIEDDLTPVSFLKHHVKETNDYETISQMLKRAVSLHNRR